MHYNQANEKGEVRTVNDNLIVRDKDILGGTPVFGGTRVPIRTLIDYLAGGETLDEFLGDFPSVTREQALQFLNMAEETLVAQAHETPH